MSHPPRVRRRGIRTIFRRLIPSRMPIIVRYILWPVLRIRRCIWTWSHSRRRWRRGSPGKACTTRIVRIFRRRIVHSIVPSWWNAVSHWIIGLGWWKRHSSVSVIISFRTRRTSNWRRSGGVHSLCKGVSVVSIRTAATQQVHEHRDAKSSKSRKSKMSSSKDPEIMMRGYFFYLYVDGLTKTSLSSSRRYAKQ